MKKIITLSITAFAFLTVQAQLPVSQVAGKKQALLEEFTGNTCGFCPDGHKRSDLITSALPGQAFAINIHSGGYATPYSGSTASLDFRTPDGDTILAMPGNTAGGFPKGSVNRRTPTTTYPSAAPYTAGGWTMNRGYWSANVNDVIAENAYVNVAGQAFLNPNSRLLIVNMEAYFTANSATASNKISIALLQNNIIAWQSGASNYYPTMLQTAGDNATYKHMHALRDIITGRATGDEMGGAVTAGTFWSKSYQYTIPATYPASGTKAIPAVLADLELVAFITEPTGNVIAVCKVPITVDATAGIGNNSNVNIEMISLVNVYPSPMASEGAIVFTLAKSNPVTINITNSLGQNVVSKKYEMLVQGEHKYELNTANLSNGVYFVNIEADGKVVTKKFSVFK